MLLYFVIMSCVYLGYKFLTHFKVFYFISPNPFVWLWEIVSIVNRGIGSYIPLHLLSTHACHSSWRSLVGRVQVQTWLRPGGWETDAHCPPHLPIGHYHLVHATLGWYVTNAPTHIWKQTWGNYSKMGLCTLMWKECVWFQGKGYCVLLSKGTLILSSKRMCAVRK